MTIQVAGNIERLRIPDSELTLGSPRWQKRLYPCGQGGTGLRLQIKSDVPTRKLDIAGRTVVGYCATWQPDLVKDQIMPGAFLKTIKERGPQVDSEGYLHSKIKLCNEHFKPIGLPFLMREDKTGLWVEAFISKTQEGLDCLELLRDGVIDSMSIGYDVVQADFDDKKGLRILRELKLYEFSLVINPANEGSRVAELKAMQEDVMDQKAIEIYGTMERAANRIADAADKLTEMAEQKAVTPETKATPDPVKLDQDCPDCGKKSLEATQHNGETHVKCSECDATHDDKPELVGEGSDKLAAQRQKSIQAIMGQAAGIMRHLAEETKSLGGAELKAHAHTMDAAARLMTCASSLMDKSGQPWGGDDTANQPPDAEKVGHVVDILSDVSEKLQKHCSDNKKDDGDGDADKKKKSVGYAWETPEAEQKSTANGIIQDGIGRLQALIGPSEADSSEAAALLAEMRAAFQTPLV